MASNGFLVGFEKTSGVSDLVTKPAKLLWKGVKTLGGGTFNTLATGAGALMEGAQGYKKMTDAATRG